MTDGAAAIFFRVDALSTKLMLQCSFYMYMQVQIKKGNTIHM